MAERWTDLPDDCWELIFDRVSHTRHLESLSLVSKRFLSISNRFRLSLTLSTPTVAVLRLLLRRFTHLKSIDLSQVRVGSDLERIVFKIARSGLNIEALNLSNQRTLPLLGLMELGVHMKSLKSLKCSRVFSLNDKDMAAIAESLPWLEELDLSYPTAGDYRTPHWSGTSLQIITDDGFEMLTSKLKGLRKINISGIYFLSDRSLIALSSNCKLLTEIAVNSCYITQHGVGFAIRHCRNLTSLSVSGFKNYFHKLLPSSDSFTIENSIPYAGALSVLEFSEMVLSDGILCSIAKALLPLRKLTIRHCENFTVSGLSSLLQACKSLNCLDLEGTEVLTDRSLYDLSQYFGSLTSINVSLCDRLTNLSFFILTRNCPSLVEIIMENTCLGKEEEEEDGDFGLGIRLDLGKNYRIQSLRLANNKHLNNAYLKIYGFICPNIRRLDLSCCPKITEEGIQEILKSCSEIRHLEVNALGRIDMTAKSDSKQSELKLEVLQAAGSMITDKAMAMLGKRCRGLLHLDLNCCKYVTPKGVVAVIENCTKLEVINLARCSAVSRDILPWMVFMSPSLRKIIPPRDFVPNESERNLFLRHGCLVCSSQPMKGPEGLP